jgi:hypothetical protein
LFKDKQDAEEYAKKRRGDSWGAYP